MVHFWGVCPSFREVQVLAIVEILMGQLEQVDFLRKFSVFQLFGACGPIIYSLKLEIAVFHNWC